MQYRLKKPTGNCLYSCFNLWRSPWKLLSCTPKRRLFSAFSRDLRIHQEEVQGILVMTVTLFSIEWSNSSLNSLLFHLSLSAGKLQWERKSNRPEWPGTGLCRCKICLLVYHQSTTCKDYYAFYSLGLLSFVYLLHGMGLTWPASYLSSSLSLSIIMTS